MAQRLKPLSPVILHGSVGYQYFANLYRDNVEYMAKVGIPVKDKDTGEVSIWPVMKDKSNLDYVAAVQIVADELEKLKNAAFQQSQNKNAVSVTPLDQQVIVADESIEPKPITEAASNGVPTADDLMQESLKLVEKSKAA